MALTAFCSTCGRTVYIDEKDTPVCPVCSAPLVEAVARDEVATDAQAPAEDARGQSPGSK